LIKLFISGIISNKWSLKLILYRKARPYKLLQTKFAHKNMDIDQLVALMDNLKLNTNDRPREDTKLQPYIQMIQLTNEMSTAIDKLKPEER